MCDKTVQRPLLSREFFSPNRKKRDFTFHPAAGFCPDQIAFSVFNNEPGFSLQHFVDGNGSRIGTDQLRCFCQNLFEKGRQVVIGIGKQFLDFTEDLDFYMLRIFLKN